METGSSGFRCCSDHASGEDDGEGGFGSVFDGGSFQELGSGGAAGVGELWIDLLLSQLSGKCGARMYLRVSGRSKRGGGEGDEVG